MMQPFRPQPAGDIACPWLVSISLLLSPVMLRAQAPPTPPAAAPQETPKPAPAQRLSQRERAWQILHDGLAENSADKRAKAVNSLGLLTRNAEAEKAAVLALKDDKTNVRVAAASALGSMRAVHAMAELENALDDDEPAVVLAAANSLMVLKDLDSAYEVYYGVLTGTTRTNKGLIKEQLKILKDKKKLAEIGVEQGIGFIPFAGFGYDAFKTIMKSDSSSVRAAAAKKLTHDPSPASAEALVAATQDKNWLVRAAALEAISERGDKTLLAKINLSLDDEKDDVRFTAAACVAHLSGMPSKRAKSAAAGGN
jgi:HEAT repeat protein